MQMLQYLGAWRTNLMQMLQYLGAWRTNLMHVVHYVVAPEKQLHAHLTRNPRALDFCVCRSETYFIRKEVLTFTGVYGWVVGA